MHPIYALAGTIVAVVSVSLPTPSEVAVLVALDNGMGTVLYAIHGGTAALPAVGTKVMVGLAVAQTPAVAPV